MIRILRRKVCKGLSETATPRAFNEEKMISDQTTNKLEAQDSTPDAASVDRTVLPVPEPKYPPITELDAHNAQAPPRFQVKAPKGAPNVVIILLDNFGFGDGSTFGGPIQMPTLDRLAETGLRYNNFKVPPLCSPSRMALLTGRNSHSANFGVISEIATAFPGYTAMRPASVTMLPEILRLNGYSTAMFGKCHELGPWEVQRRRSVRSLAHA